MKGHFRSLCNDRILKSFTHFDMSAVLQRLPPMEQPLVVRADVELDLDQLLESLHRVPEIHVHVTLGALKDLHIDLHHLDQHLGERGV